MKYCKKCGKELVENARFCNACGAPVEFAPTTDENPYANEAPVYKTQPVNVKTEAPKSDEELRAEEQALLDKFSLGLKHERLAWKITGVVWVAISAFYSFFGLVLSLLMGAAIAAEGGEFLAFIPVAIIYTFMGAMFLPIAIINLSMNKKLVNYRAKLYTDCQDGIGHFSVGSIVFCAFFNGVALVFNIVYFIIAKNNTAVIERIKARQNEYNSQQ